MSAVPRGERGADGQSGTTRKAMLLRLDPEVHAALAGWAADDLRSTNAHVEWLLRRALNDAGRLPAQGAGRARRRRRTAEEG